MSLPSSMADFVPCDRLLQKAYWFPSSAAWPINYSGSVCDVFSVLLQLFQTEKNLSIISVTSIFRRNLSLPFLKYCYFFVLENLFPISLH